MFPPKQLMNKEMYSFCFKIKLGLLALELWLELALGAWSEVDRGESLLHRASKCFHIVVN